MNTGWLREDPRVTAGPLLFRAIVVCEDELDPGVRITARGCGEEALDRALALLPNVRSADDAGLDRTTRIGVGRRTVGRLLLRAVGAIDGVADRERSTVRGVTTVRGAVLRDCEAVRDESVLRLGLLRRMMPDEAEERATECPRLTVRGEDKRELRATARWLEDRLTRELTERLELRGLDRAKVSAGFGRRQAIRIRVAYHRIVLDRNMATALVLSEGPVVLHSPHDLSVVVLGDEHELNPLWVPRLPLPRGFSPLLRH